MKRRLFNLLTVLSLLLSVAVGVLWVRSHFGSHHDRDAASFHAGAMQYSVVLSRGSVQGQAIPRSVRADGSLRPSRAYLYDDPRPPARVHSFAGAWLKETPLSQPPSYYEFGLPLWLPAVAALVLPLAWWMTTGRRQWRAVGQHGVGHCPRCGYDLRATPDRCPECGNGAAAGGGA